MILLFSFVWVAEGYFFIISDITACFHLKNDKHGNFCLLCQDWLHGYVTVIKLSCPMFWKHFEFLDLIKRSSCIAEFVSKISVWINIKYTQYLSNQNWGEWPNGLRRRNKIGRLPAQVPPGACSGLGTQDSWWPLCRNWITVITIKRERLPPS